MQIREGNGRVAASGKATDCNYGKNWLQEGWERMMVVTLVFG